MFHIENVALTDFHYDGISDVVLNLFKECSSMEHKSVKQTNLNLMPTFTSLTSLGMSIT